MFDHERLKVYQETLRFIVWLGPVIEGLPAKLAARDQLDRASTSIALNLAEGNGKRSYLDRCRYFDTARGSGVECAACLDVLVARGVLTGDQVAMGKGILLEIVLMIAGLISRFSEPGGRVTEAPSEYGFAVDEKETENEERERS